MNLAWKVCATLALAVSTLAVGADEESLFDRPLAMSSAAPSHYVGARIARLHHDPKFILEAVAQRMGITLRREAPVPEVLLESKTPLARLQAAAERQWGFRPRAFASAFALAVNEIYLIDDAAVYEQRGGTLDDALAHEFVHYLQATYQRASLHSDWSEFEAVAIQAWFRAEHMQPRLVAVDVRTVR